MTNRLVDATSPYLQQHKDNPVDWWPWCDEAFEEAKRREVPIFLSIGYAACHWCHVMAHESFEDDATAALLNANFVSIKVDREERPDVDAVYMAAVQGLTGHGGWPMSVFLNLDREPFHAGTYFPFEPRAGMPSFRQVLAAVSEAWTRRRSEIDEGAAKITRALTAQQARAISEDGHQSIDRDQLDAATDIAVQRLAHEFDPVNAGFGTAPKFPPSTVLRFLFRHHRRTGSREAFAMAVETCEAMARGGIYDQLGGGFARYSVDAQWRVPHFEKMLYDNALLLSVYTDWFAATGSEVARRVCDETAEFLLRDLRTTEGGFASSLDADASNADGVVAEGASYAWTPAQLKAVLGDADGDRAAALLGVTPSGTFEHGTSVLQLLEDPAVVITDVDDPETWWARARIALLGVRQQRPAPSRDDKVVAAWNGLAITSLATAGRLLGRPDWIEAAIRAAKLLVAIHLKVDDDGTILRRVSRDGRAARGAPGVLEDYGNVAEGFLALFAVTGELKWFEAAGQLLDTVLREFSNPAGGFFDTAASGEALIVRLSDPADLASPSGWSSTTNAMLTYGTLATSDEHLRAAEAGLGIAAQLGSHSPRFAGWLLAASEAFLDGPFEVIVVGADDNPGRTSLRDAALRSDRPGAVVVAGPPRPDSDGPFADRPAVGGDATVYVCHGSYCEPPVHGIDELVRLLKYPART